MKRARLVPPPPAPSGLNFGETHPARRRNADRHQLHQRLCIWFKLRSELIGWMMEHDFLSGTEARAVPMTRETINTTC
jgi:hypothetical protein